METFIIDVPVPSMGATVSEMNVIVIKVAPGERVTKGQRMADLESDKSAFEFESPCDGVIHAIAAKGGQIMQSGDLFLQIETSDASMLHLKSQTASTSAAPAPAAAPKAAGAVVWTPKATKLAQEAGLDPAKITDIEATGPGNRVSSEDVQRYLAKRKG
ncbi:MAG: E3 binding domain-containing protein [Opitutaceae bacterium]|nr:E3 binding domain-containing protein [Opitutaceae bacterium]